MDRRPTDLSAYSQYLNEEKEKNDLKGANESMQNDINKHTIDELKKTIL